MSINKKHDSGSIKNIFFIKAMERELSGGKEEGEENKMMVIDGNDEYSIWQVGVITFSLFSLIRRTR